MLFKKRKGALSRRCAQDVGLSRTKLHSVYHDSPEKLEELVTSSALLRNSRLSDGQTTKFPVWLAVEQNMVESNSSTFDKGREKVFRSMYMVHEDWILLFVLQFLNKNEWVDLVRTHKCKIVTNLIVWLISYWSIVHTLALNAVDIHGVEYGTANITIKVSGLNR